MTYINTKMKFSWIKREPGIWWSCPASFAQIYASAPSVFPLFSEPVQHRFVSHWALFHSSHLQPSVINKRLAVLRIYRDICIPCYLKHHMCIFDYCKRSNSLMNVCKTEKNVLLRQYLFHLMHGFLHYEQIKRITKPSVEKQAWFVAFISSGLSFSSRFYVLPVIVNWQKATSCQRIKSYSTLACYRHIHKLIGSLFQSYSSR